MSQECFDDGISPVVCDEVVCPVIVSSDCVYYDQYGDVGCSPEIAISHPDIPNTIIVGDDNTIDKRFEGIAENIGDQVCYVLSKTFMEKIWDVIKNDSELFGIHCEIMCNCPCNISPSCPTLIIESYEGGVNCTITNTNDPSIDPVDFYHLDVYQDNAIVCTYEVTGPIPFGTTIPFTIPCASSQDEITSIVITFEINGILQDITCEVPTQ